MQGTLPIRPDPVQDGSFKIGRDSLGEGKLLSRHPQRPSQCYMLLTLAQLLGRTDATVYVLMAPCMYPGHLSHQA